MDLVRLLKARSASALDLDAEGRVLVRSDSSGTFQLYELDAGELRPLTDFPEPVTGRYIPGTRQAVAQMDRGGNERHQLYRFDLDDPPLADLDRLEPLAVSPAHQQALIGVAPDGSSIAYISNRRNDVDFDVYVLDLRTGDDRRIFDAGGWSGAASGFSPDGRWLSFELPGERPLDVGLRLVALESGALHEVLPHPDEAAIVGQPAWAGADACFVSTNVGRDLTAIAYHDAVSGSTATVLERPHDLQCYSSADGRTLLVVANERGAAACDFYDVADGGALHHAGAMSLPDRGVLDVAGVSAPPPPLLSADGSSVVFTFMSPRMPSDVWRYDRATASLERLTDSAGFGEAGDELVAPTEHRVASFDGEEVALFLYRPPGDPPAERWPVVVAVHGGPEAQATLRFDARVQGLVGRGFAVVVPNVRGSTGYGKRFAALDDTTRRLDSVADLAAVHLWLASEGLDPERAALFGGSYGGYMVLAGCAFQPALWAAGVAFVAISDLVTFLQNTSAYRRAHREREYGSLEHDRAFLESASPMRRVGDMRAPLFLVHGENDPRVPVSEARQLQAALATRGVPCELVTYADEGHGLTRLANILDAIPRAVDFLAGVLQP
jgi:dipeptidyl aminopeptidase/acylaminoacyl peptidase